VRIGAQFIWLREESAYQPICPAAVEDCLFGEHFRPTRRVSLFRLRVGSMWATAVQRFSLMYPEVARRMGAERWLDAVFSPRLHLTSCINNKQWNAARAWQYMHAE
jgi:hypothetical protein